MNDVQYWVAFNLIPGIGRARFALLEKRFGRLEQAWRASASELAAAGLDDKSVAAIMAYRPRISPEAEMEKLARHHVQALTWNDPAYPRRLKEVYDLPPVLYLRGNLTPQDEWSVAVVGTRRSTVYGREVAQQIVSDLARQRITIVSGLARGIDAIAHRAALDANGRTIAVLACGLDMVYPANHAPLAREILGRGALISEYPLGTRPRAEYFPRRNRIMSGISLGVLVVEAPLDSGAMHTVNWALEQNREVFAVPGSIFSPASTGTNRLIQEGAKLVTGYQDILEELNLNLGAPQAVQPPLPLPAGDALETALLRHLSAQPVHIDDLRRASGLPIAAVSSTLALMEIKGMVRQVGGMHFILTREARESYEATAH